MKSKKNTVTIQELVNRMAKEGIPYEYAIKLTQQSGSWGELKLRIQNYLSSIDAENIRAKTDRICKR